MVYAPVFVPTPPNIVALDRLGDEIAELSAHLEAATARLLSLIRAFDARGGWAVHEMGYTVERRPDGSLHFRRPSGDPLPDVPPPSAVPADPVSALRARHADEGVAVDARTLQPSWLGERLDLGWAIDVLHPLSNPTAPDRT